MGGYVGRLRKKHTVISSGVPLWKAENNLAPAIAIEKLFGPIEIEG
jgi:hypothetical protein